MAAIGLIAQNPGSSGYDLLKVFDLSLANVWPATQSQLYGELNRLADDGLIEVTATGKRGRKEYSITDTGRVALREWLLDGAVEPTRSALMLKVFLLTEVDDEYAQEFLAGMTERARDGEAALRDLHSSIDWAPDDVMGELVLDWGLRMYRTQQEWAEHARRTLKQRTK